MKKIIYILFLSIGVMTFMGCELDLQDSPNVLAPGDADVDFVLNGIELSFASFYHTSSDRGAETTRMENLGGPTWENAFAATDFDGIWINAYANVLIEANVLQAIATEKEFYHHTGIAQAISAYTMVTLVDLFGDVPYSEALDGLGNLLPSQDKGADIYAAALVKLDSAIINLKLTPAVGATSDLIYGGDAALWTTFAKTLQLRIHLQQRLVNEEASTKAIEALLTEDDLIDTDEEAFFFQYGTNLQAPASQHPNYSANYAGGAAEYMSNSFMDLMYYDKPNPDPRMTYYFYRQDVDETTDVTEKDCIGGEAPIHYGDDDAYCGIGEGYWGRDHLDDAGIPPDGQKRTVFGAYPAGGKYDNSDDVLVANGDGLGGAGIQPIIMPAFVDFMKAESALTLGTPGNARAFFEEGIKKSMGYVTGFAAGNATPANITDYITSALGQYNAATTDEEKLAVVMKEYYIALWGNGIDAFNNYRRTGYPKEPMQPAVRTANAGTFYRTFLYPASYVDRNANAEQKANTAVQTFWDNHPAGFVD